MSDQLSLKAKIDLLLSKFQLYKYNKYRSPHTGSTADAARFVWSCLTWSNLAFVSKYLRF